MVCHYWPFLCRRSHAFDHPTPTSFSQLQLLSSSVTSNDGSDYTHRVPKVEEQFCSGFNCCGLELDDLVGRTSLESTTSLRPAFLVSSLSSLVPHPASMAALLPGKKEEKTPRDRLLAFLSSTHLLTDLRSCLSPKPSLSIFLNCSTSLLHLVSYHVPCPAMLFFGTGICRLDCRTDVPFLYILIMHVFNHNPSHSPSCACHARHASQPMSLVGPSYLSPPLHATLGHPALFQFVSPPPCPLVLLCVSQLSHI